MENKRRETFSGTLTIFLATLGSAVGLGNIWKFPYLTGQNGGGAFVLAYLFCVLLVGIPIMVGEFYIGRKSRKNAVGAFTALKAPNFFKSIGYFGTLSAFIIMFYYSAVAGWVYSYVFKAVTGKFELLSSMPMEKAVKFTSDTFTFTAAGSFYPMLWQAIVFIIVSAILMAGIKNGIEKVTKVLMPVLFLLIIICDIRALTLPKATEGLNFLFSVDPSKLSKSVLLTALGLAFFKLSLGMGTMITYGSYFTEDEKLINTSLKVALSDTLVSLLAGVAIFPVVFQFGMEPSGGAGLLFKTIPLVFSKMPFGNILLAAFFLLASIAATTAMISIVEVPVAFISEEFKLNRKQSVLITTLFMFAIGVLTVHPKSIFGSVTILNKNFFDNFDFLSSNILLPLGGLLIAIYIGYFVYKEHLKTELLKGYRSQETKIFPIYRFIIKYLTPILLLIVFLNSIGILKI